MQSQNIIMNNNVVLVDENDNQIGELEKIEAHIQGKLHRAFSVFIFNENGELLLQKRADDKYHGAGLWTNTCCSHPQINENVLDSAKKRLQFEMGMECDLKKVYSFIYNEKVENNLIEHELDHVFIGYSSKNPIPNLKEVKDFKWMNISEIFADTIQNPTHYTVWFKKALPTLVEMMKI